MSIVPGFGKRDYFHKHYPTKSKGFYNVLLVEIIWNEVMINSGHLKIEHLIHLTLRQNF